MCVYIYIVYAHW